MGSTEDQQPRERLKLRTGSQGRPLMVPSAPGGNELAQMAAKVPGLAILGRSSPGTPLTNGDILGTTRQ
jgi:hypothetical protein